MKWAQCWVFGGVLTSGEGVWLENYLYIDKMAVSTYCIHCNFHGVNLLQILDFSNFHIFIFMDSRVLPLHKSPI